MNMMISTTTPAPAPPASHGGPAAAMLPGQDAAAAFASFMDLDPDLDMAAPAEAAPVAADGTAPPADAVAMPEPAAAEPLGQEPQQGFDAMQAMMLSMPVPMAQPMAMPPALPPAMPGAQAAPDADGRQALPSADMAVAMAVGVAATVSAAPAPAPALGTSLPVLAAPVATAAAPQPAGAGKPQPGLTSAPVGPAAAASAAPAQAPAPAPAAVVLAAAMPARAPADAPAPAEAPAAPVSAAGGLATAALPAATSELKLAPATPAAWQQPLRQALGEQLQLQLSRNIDQAVIRLDPPNLGRIEIAIRHMAGSLEVNISATHSEVVRQLNTISDTMRIDLAARQFTDVAVNVTSATRAGAAAQQAFDQQGRQRQQDGAAEESDPGRALAEAGNPSSTFSLNGREYIV